MAVIMKPKYSAVASSVPTTANLADGEMAFNITDGKIFKRVGATIYEVANKVDTSGFQASNLDLTAIATANPTTGEMIYWSGASAVTPIATTAFGRSLLNVANAADARTGIGAGTVSSVGISPPAAMTVVSGSPVTGSGTINLSWGFIPPNQVLAGPSSGGGGNPSFRELAQADIPTLTTGKISDLTSGSYTPVATLGTNMASATSLSALYTRIGDIVTVSGRMTADPTAASAQTEVSITLPIASDIAASTDVEGVATAHLTTVSAAGFVYGDPTNNRAVIRFASPTTVALNLFYSFHYRLL